MVGVDGGHVIVVQIHLPDAIGLFLVQQVQAVASPDPEPSVKILIDGPDRIVGNGSRVSGIMPEMDK